MFQIAVVDEFSHPFVRHPLPPPRPAHNGCYLSTHSRPLQLCAIELAAENHQLLMGLFSHANATRKVLGRGLGEHLPPVPVTFTGECERVPPWLGTRQGHHNFQRLLGSVPRLNALLSSIPPDLPGFAPLVFMLDSTQQGVLALVDRATTHHQVNQVVLGNRNGATGKHRMTVSV